MEDPCLVRSSFTAGTLIRVNKETLFLTHLAPAVHVPVSIILVRFELKIEIMELIMKMTKVAKNPKDRKVTRLKLGLDTNRNAMNLMDAIMTPSHVEHLMKSSRRCIRIQKRR